MWPLSGNSLYLICTPCENIEEKDFGFKLAERGIIGAYEVFGPAAHTAQFTSWLKKHQRCGGKGNPDHFSLGHRFARNEDQPGAKKPQMHANGSPPSA
jgi:hypothetical protein